MASIESDGRMSELAVILKAMKKYQYSQPKAIEVGQQFERALWGWRGLLMWWSRWSHLGLERQISDNIGSHIDHGVDISKQLLRMRRLQCFSCHAVELVHTGSQSPSKVASNRRSST